MNKLFLVLAAFISFCSHAHNCGGEYQPETGTCRLIGPDGRQVLYNVGVPQSSPPRKTIQYVKVYVPSKYGAIALNKKTGHTGAVINASSKAIAKRDAIKSCEQKAKGPCKVVQWVRNGCLAAVQGKIGKNATLFTAAEEIGLAESVAMKRCINAGAKQCQPLLPEGCSLPDDF